MARDSIEVESYPDTDWEDRWPETSNPDNITVTEDAAFVGEYGAHFDGFAIKRSQPNDVLEFHRLTPSSSNLNSALECWENVYVVGDVHGCFEPLEALLAKLDPGRRELVVFVGDLVRKGPDSKGVIDLIRSNRNLVSVLGNNERKLLRGRDQIADFGSAEYAFMRSLPTVVSWAGGMVVHGGVDPAKLPAEHSRDELLTKRTADEGESFWFDEYEGPPRVYFGHTAFQTPLESEWAVGLDTGCVYGGELTAYDVRRERFVSVDGVEHVTGGDDAILQRDAA